MSQHDQDENLTIRSAEEKDAKRIWEIRNQPESRSNSGESSEIDFEDHRLWFKRKYFEGGSNVCYVLEVQGLVIGYVRFDVVDEKIPEYRISIALDSSRCGKGLGSFLLRGAIEQFGSSGRKITAVVNPGNMASRKLFSKCGFVTEAGDSEKILFTYQQ